jgi:hypothetical protein
MNWRALWERMRGKAQRRPGRPARPAAPHGLPSYLAGRFGTRAQSFVALDPKTNFRLYRDMRCCFPVLDVAITKLVRLVGHVEIIADEGTRAELVAWMERVQVNALQRGFDAWLGSHLDTMLQYGKAVGEIVPNRSRSEVFALTSLDPATVELRTVPEQPLSLDVVQWQGAGWVALPRPYVLVSLHSPQGDNPHGVSLYRSLPLAAEALSVIENATVQVWQRMGAPPYHVNWRPHGEFQDPDGTLTEGAVARMQEQFTAAMEARTKGEVRDFFSAGEVTVDVIGNKNALFDIQQPFRAFAEQIVAATGLPSWMFGFNWSSTETLSVQQADMIVANVEALRRMVQPAVEQVLDLRQRLRGRPPVKVGWSAVNLRDLTEEARGRSWSEQAQARRIENGRRMWELGYWNQEQAGRHADPTLERIAREYTTPPAAAERLPVGLHPATGE